MADVQLQRSAGILLHPTSLPGRFGIGDLGPAAHAWVDALARARLAWWQLLPLGPTGAGDSPYQSFSAFAGNTLLINPEALAADVLLTAEDLDWASMPDGPVDYGAVIPRKAALLDRAWARYQRGAAAADLRPGFEAFQVQQAAWLDDLALFLALKRSKAAAGGWRGPRSSGCGSRRP